MAQGLKSGNRIDRIWDINPNVGGPIVKDRLWIYGGYRHWGTYNSVAGSFKDADFTEHSSIHAVDRAEPVPGVASERRRAVHDAGQLRRTS